MDKSELDNILQRNPLVLVAFLSPGCGACKAAKPKIEQLQSDWVIAMVNINAAQWVSGIDRVPTLRIYHNGAVVKETVGFDKEEIVSSLQGLQTTGSNGVPQLRVRPWPDTENATLFTVKSVKR